MLNINISTNFLILISIVVFVIIVGCIAYIIYKDRKNDREEIDDLIDDLVKAKPRDEKENLIKQEIEISIGDINEEPKLDNKVNLEDMLNKMQKNLECKPEEAISVFENEQEEKAIISYQELLSNLDKDEFKKEIKHYEQEEELIKSSEIFTKNEKVDKEIIKEILENKEPKADFFSGRKDKKFKNTDFISPIFGKMEPKIEYPTIKAVPKKKDDLEEYFEDDYKHAKTIYSDYLNDQKYDINENKTIEEIVDIEPLNEEIKKNDDFLKALKEFRSNL